MSTPLSRAANQFAFDLFSTYLERHKGKYKNLLLCPYLIFQSLAMMLVGAKNNTEQQLFKVLHMPAGEEDARHKEFLLLTEQLLHGNHEFVHLASFIYIDKAAKRTERFKQILRDYYETKPKKIPFDDLDLLVKTINEDVARTTENIYNEILSKEEASKYGKNHMLLVNAVFFRGYWMSNFTDKIRLAFNYTPCVEGETQAMTLNASVQQTRTKMDMDMMRKLDYLPLIESQALDARIIRLPFEASDLQMWIILPNNIKSDSTYLLDKINSSIVNELFAKFSSSKHTYVRITMPTFCIDSGKISIQATLCEMGANDLFDSKKADLSGLCSNQHVWLHKILHRCFIIIDNRGAITSSGHELARKRSAQLSLTSPPEIVPSVKPPALPSTTSPTIAHKISNPSSVYNIQDFIVDHPFMYLIVDQATKTILLMGLFTDPRENIEIIHESQLSKDELHAILTEGVYK